MARDEYKVFDLEMVGVPVRNRRPWRIVVLFLIGAMTGASAAIVYYEPMVARREARDQRVERQAAEEESARVLGRLLSATAKLETLQGEMTQMRYERDRLMGDLQRLQSALADSETARAAAEEAVRRGGVSRPYLPQPPEFSRIESERSPPPVSVDRFLPEDYEEEPEIRRIFVAKSAGITLEDLSRHYGVSVRSLRRANPELRFTRGASGYRIPAGSRVRVPVAE